MSRGLITPLISRFYARDPTPLSGLKGHRDSDRPTGHRENGYTAFDHRLSFGADGASNYGYFVRTFFYSYLRVKPDFKLKPFKGAAVFYYYGWRKDGVGYIDRSTARKGQEYIDKWKLFIPRAWGSGSSGNDKLNAFVAGPNTLCTETYSVIGPFDTQEEAENVLSYINTKFFHFMVSIVKITQAGAKHVYKFVPAQDYSQPISDEYLYKKYGLSEEEIEYIEQSIWPDKDAVSGGDE